MTAEPAGFSTSRFANPSSYRPRPLVRFRTAMWSSRAFATRTPSVRGSRDVVCHPIGCRACRRRAVRDRGASVLELGEMLLGAVKNV